MQLTMEDGSCWFASCYRKRFVGEHAQEPSPESLLPHFLGTARRLEVGFHLGIARSIHPLLQ